MTERDTYYFRAVLPNHLGLCSKESRNDYGKGRPEGEGGEEQIWWV